MRGFGQFFTEDELPQGEIESFLARIRVNIHDRLPRAVFADWLEERNAIDEESAKHLRYHEGEVTIQQHPGNGHIIVYPKMSRRMVLNAYSDWLESQGMAPELVSSYTNQFANNIVAQYDSPIGTYVAAVLDARRRYNSGTVYLISRDGKRVTRAASGDHVQHIANQLATVARGEQ